MTSSVKKGQFFFKYLNQGKQTTSPFYTLFWKHGVQVHPQWIFYFEQLLVSIFLLKVHVHVTSDSFVLYEFFTPFWMRIYSVCYVRIAFAVSWVNSYPCFETKLCHTYFLNPLQRSTSSLYFRRWFSQLAFWLWFARRSVLYVLWVSRPALATASRSEPFKVHLPANQARISSVVAQIRAGLLGATRGE